MIACLQNVNESPKIIIHMKEDLEETSNIINNFLRYNKDNIADRILTETNRKCIFIKGNIL